jgi:uncharacterized RDD family membrane protein YckC
MNQTAASDVVQAGFLRRWAALLIDNLLLTVGFYAVIFVLFFIVGVTGMAGDLSNVEAIDENNPPSWLTALYIVGMLLYYVAAGAYYSVMESSSAQATLGKQAMGIKVVDANGERLTLPHAIGRWFAASLSYLTCYIGFLMAAFTREKRALHDYVAGTFVVDKWAYTDRPELQKTRPGGCLFVFFAGLVLLVVGVLAAIAVPAYKHYLDRAKALEVMRLADGWKIQVAEAVMESTYGTCPVNGDDGFGAPESYVSKAVNRVVFGEFEEGLCGISIWIPPISGNVEQQIMFEYDPDEDRWYCSTTLPDSIAPPTCR